MIMKIKLLAYSIQQLVINKADILVKVSLNQTGFRNKLNCSLINFMKAGNKANSTNNRREL